MSANEEIQPALEPAGQGEVAGVKREDTPATDGIAEPLGQDQV